MTLKRDVTSQNRPAGLAVLYGPRRDRSRCLNVLWSPTVHTVVQQQQQQHRQRAGGAGRAVLPLGVGALQGKAAYRQRHRIKRTPGLQLSIPITS
eukprot:3031814-Pleurochrysis_carterae.AAC.2